MKAKDVLKVLMMEEPTVMDMLTPAEAAMKPASKPTPASKKNKKSALKPLPVASTSLLPSESLVEQLGSPCPS